MKSDLLRLVDECLRGITRILSAPIGPDPAAPSGFVTKEYHDAELARRLAAMREAYQQLIAEVAARYGQKAAGTVRELTEKAQREAAREVGLDPGDGELH